MIVTNTTFVVFKVINGTWQLQLSFFVYAAYMFTYPNYDISSGVLTTRDLNQVCGSTLISCTAMHFYLFLVNYIFRYLDPSWQFVQAVLSMLGMFWQIYSMSMAGQVVYFIHWNISKEIQTVNLDTLAMGQFFFVETCLFTNIVVSNFLFMLFRSIWKHKVDPAVKLESAKQLQQIDTLDALSPLSNQFENMCVPLLTTVMLIQQDLFNSWPTHHVQIVLDLIVISGSFSLVDLFLQQFISWKKGPEIWKTTAPIIYFINLMMTYFFWPIVNLTYFLFAFLAHFDEMFSSDYSGWGFTFVMLEVLWIIDFFVYVRKGPLKDSIKYLKMVSKAKLIPEDVPQGKRMAIILCKEVLKQAIDKNQKSYRKQIRKYGEGQLRIGQCLELGEDIYCLAYVCMLRDDLIDKYICVETNLRQDEKANKKLELQQQLKDELGDSAVEYDENSKPVFESDSERRYFIMENKRTNLIISALVTFGSQVILVGLIMNQIMTEQSDFFFIKTTEFYQTFVRFICTLILHLTVQGELCSSLQRMKFVLNHGYKFSSPSLAFVNTFCQATSVILVEFTSIFVIITSFSPENTVINFIGLAVIAGFDDYVFGAIHNEILLELLSDDFCDELCVISHTTSKRAKTWEKAEKFDGEFVARGLKVDYMARTLSNKIKWACYKVIRIFYVSLYFYFLPLSVVIIPTYLPLLQYFTMEEVDPDY